MDELSHTELMNAEKVLYDLVVKETGMESDHKYDRERERDVL